MMASERVHPFQACWVFASAMGAAGLLETFLLAPPAALAGWGRERALALVTGNFLSGLAIALIIMVLPALFRRRRWSLGGALFSGLFVGILGPIGSGLSRLGLLQDPQSVAWAAIPVIFLGISVGNSWQAKQTWIVKRLPFFFLTACCLATAAWTFQAPAPETASPSLSPHPTSPVRVSEDQPDVILISFDTLRSDAVVGNNRALVPTWDRLRKDSLWSPWAWSSSNQTIPGHWGLFTGLETQRHGVPNNTYKVPKDKKVLAERFQEAGWQTLATVSNRLLRKGEGFERGFRYYDDRPAALHQPLKTLASITWLGWFTTQNLMDSVMEIFVGQKRIQDSRETDIGMGHDTVQAAKILLKQAFQKPQPAFVFLHFMDAHAPYRAPAPFSSKRTPLLTDPIQKSDRHRADYFEEVDFLDSCLQEILKLVEERGRPFVLALTGDHGEYLGEHQLFGHSKHLYQEVIQVPFFLYGSRIPAKELPPVHVSDIAPSLLARAGIPWQPADFDGQNLLAPNTNLNQRLRVARDHHHATVMKGPWKWIGSWQGKKEPGLWFRLDEDPQENNPLPEAEIPLEFRKTVIATLKILQSGGTAELENSSERIDALQALGYLDVEEDS